MSRREEPAPRGVLAEVGALGTFTVRAVGGLRHVRPYLGEALRQAALIGTGSTLVIIVVAFLAGGSCGLESSSLARSFGTPSVSGGFSAWCTLREVVPFVFGYILAAKVGCGIVAELGAMRVNEEVDALEAMGVRTLAYLVGSRMLAAAVMLPLAYVLAVGSADAAAYLMSVLRFGDVSRGTWQLYFLAFQSPADVLFSLAKGLAISAFVVLSALRFGYAVRGGPVEVGDATARSMATAIVGVTVISMLGTVLFWGADPRIPLG